MTSNNEIIWAAGFFDGEGSLHIAKKVNHVRIALGQVDPRPLERFQRAVGVGRVYGPYRSKRWPVQREQWAFRTGKKDEINHILNLLWPWLDEYTKETIRERLATVEHVERRFGKAVVVPT